MIECAIYNDTGRLLQDHSVPSANLTWIDHDEALAKWLAGTQSDVIVYLLRSLEEYARWIKSIEPLLPTEGIPVVLVSEPSDEISLIRGANEHLVFDICSLPAPDGMLEYRMHQALVAFNQHLELASVNNDLQMLRYEDPIAKTLTRAAFQSSLHIEIARAWRHRAPVCLGLMEIECLSNSKRKDRSVELNESQLNDLIAFLGNQLNKVFREMDIVGRIAPNCFGICLPSTAYHQGIQTFERTRITLSEATLPESLEGLTLITRFGVSHLIHSDRRVADLYNRANHALRDAKVCDESVVRAMISNR